MTCARLHWNKRLRRAGDPFFRAALHLLRAEWAVAAGRPAAAVPELRWHENSDLVDGYPDVAQPIDVDVAFGTLARWRRARLLDAESPGQPEACRAWRDVARLWTSADAPVRARAAAGRGCAAVAHD